MILTTSFNLALLSLHPLYHNYLPLRNVEQHGANVILIDEDFLTLVKWFQASSPSLTDYTLYPHLDNEGGSDHCA